MNINTNINLRERSKVTLSGFKGLDTLSASVDVSAIHSTEMQNLISRDGVNHKRYGWKTKFVVRDIKTDGTSYYPKIQGIFDFNIYNKNFLLAYAGKKFWLIDKNNKTCTSIVSKKIDIYGNLINLSETELKQKYRVNLDELEDVECNFFINGNKVYFIGMGDFLVFSQWGEFFELRRVVDNEDVYIPTTTENIGSEEYGKDFVRVTAEERNILSPYFYNTLIGPKTLENNSDATYYLDTKDFESAEIKLTLLNENGEEVEIDFNYSDKVTAYQEGEKIHKISFLLKPLLSAISYDFSQGFLDSYDYRWFSFSDFQIAKNKYGNDTWTLLTEEEYGDKGIYGNYQGYLDAMFKYYTGKEPDYSFTESVHGIEIDNFSIEKNDIQLINMKSGDSLLIKNIINSVSNEIYSIESSRRIVYTYPTEVKSYLIYKCANGDEEILSENIAKVSIESLNINIDNMTLDGNLKYEYPNKEISLNLTRFDAVISSIVKDLGYNKKDVYSMVNGEYRLEVSSVEGRITLKGNSNENAYAPVIPDVPNIRVKLSKNVDSQKIIKSIKGCEFGLNGVTDRMFVVDNTGNTIRWSKDEDFTYFGEKSWCVCGTADKKITGLDRLNDTTLLAIKEYSAIEPSVYVIKGNMVISKTEADTTEYTSLFTPYGYQIGMGAVGEIKYFNGECLMVANDGLYAIVLGENMTVDSRYLVNRSKQISNSLEKFDLKNAKAYSFNGKFYFSVGGEEKECFVADAKYTTSYDGALNYEWWRWTNIPVSVWGVVNNKLYFGTDNGQICSFENTFNDEVEFELKSPVVLYETLNDKNIIGFVFKTGEDIKGYSFTPTCDFYGGITTKNFSVVGNETRFYLPLDTFTSEKIFIDNKEYLIKKEELYFSINEPINKPTVTIFRNYKNQKLFVKEYFGDYFTVADKQDNVIVWLPVQSNNGLNPPINEFSALLSNKKSVVAKWVSGSMDLGVRNYSKVLTSLTITGEKDLANQLKYGIRTRTSKVDYTIFRANNDLNFIESSLDSTSLDFQFASSYSRRLNMRNANFIVFYYTSDTSEDISINSVEIEFKIYKRNKGVM